MTEEARNSINQFMSDYGPNREKYQKICDTAEQKLQDLCKQKGIMAKVNGRVKDTRRLREKLIKRHEQEGRPYRTVDEIHQDISDLIGLRIALYFPSDAQKIRPLLSPHFVVLGEPKVFPIEIDEFDKYEKKGFTAYKRKIYPGYDHRKFDGYGAIHYRVRLADWPVDIEPKPIIEIQVASLLMHAWSEVEHDLAYKKKMGDVSAEEYACLDELNGMVMAGELALNRLSRLSQQRIRSVSRFDTHYTLYAYLSEWLKDNNLGDKDLGNVETLFNAYEARNFLSREDVQGELDKIAEQAHLEPDPLADLLLEQFSRRDHRTLVKKVLSQAIAQINDSEGESITDTQVGNFLGKWNALEDKIRKVLARFGYFGIRSGEIRRLLVQKQILGEEIGAKFDELRIRRNDIVHGYMLPGKAEFAQIMDDIESLRRELEREYGV